MSCVRRRKTNCCYISYTHLHRHEYVPDFEKKKKSHILYNKNYCSVQVHNDIYNYINDRTKMTRHKLNSSLRLIIVFLES